MKKEVYLTNTTWQKLINAGNREIKGGKKTVSISVIKTKWNSKETCSAPGPEDVCTVCHPYVEKSVDWPAL